MAGILAYGAYIPRLRLQRSAIYQANRWFAPALESLAKGERAIANWDEDVITLSVEAARDCLAGRDRSEVRGMFLASTSFPFSDRQNSGIAKEALSLDDDISSLDVGSSQKAGTSALVQALHAAEAGAGPILVAAAEKRRLRPASEGELVSGDGAACFLVGKDEGIARLIGSHHATVDFVDHFRPQDRPFDYSWEPRWVRHEGFDKLVAAAIAQSLERYSISGPAITHLIVGIQDPVLAVALARRNGIAPKALGDDLTDVLGHLGCAQPIALLAHALERANPGEKLMVVGFGQGVDVILLEATAAIARCIPSRGVSGSLARGLREENYLKYLAFAGHLHLEQGKRAEFEQKPALSALYRNRKTVLGLIGGRCKRTGAIQIPRSEISVAAESAVAGTQEDYPLAERSARVLTFTADHLAYTPDPPCYYGMIEFDGGGRMATEFTDVSENSIRIGARVSMRFRIKAKDERTGFVQYFWKAVPDPEGG